MHPRRLVCSAFVLFGLAGVAGALPDGHFVQHGQVQVSQPAANIVQILQSSPQAILNWTQFNIGPGEIVRFLQPNQLSAILNRVTGLDPSVIQGLLQGNGRVFLIIPTAFSSGQTRSWTSAASWRPPSTSEMKTFLRATIIWLRVPTIP